MHRQGVLLSYCCIDLAAMRNCRAVRGETQTAPCGRSRARASNASLVGANTAVRGKQHLLLCCLDAPHVQLKCQQQCTAVTASAAHPCQQSPGQTRPSGLRR